MNDDSTSRTRPTDEAQRSARTTAASSAAPEAGEVFGPYEILEVLGRGGQGVVFRARDPRLGREVALKVLHIAESRETLLRFRREAAIASKIDHPGLCTIFDAGDVGGKPYIAMRLVKGRSLAQMAAQKTDDSSFFAAASSTAAEVGDSRATVALPKRQTALTSDAAEVARKLDLFEKIARALHVVHEAGIVHRDIKPANIMVTPEGAPVLMDFGLARADDSDQTLTREGDIFGTPAYMSPEQLSRGATLIDRRTDIWSLGVAFYEVLAGRRPFEAPTREALYRSILSDEPETPTGIRHRSARDLLVVVATALAKEPDRRYQSAEAFANDLAAVLAGRPIAARPIGPIGRLWRFARREPFKAAFVGLIFVTLPAIAGLTTKYLADAEGRRRLHAIDLEQAKDARLAEGFYEMTEGRPEASPAIFESVLQMEGGSPDAVAGLVLAALQSGDRARAVRTLDRFGSVLSGTWGKKELSRLAGAGSGAGAESRSTAAESASRPYGVEATNGIALTGVSISGPMTALDWFIAAETALEEGERGARARFKDALIAAERAIVLSPTPRYHHYGLALHAAGHACDRDQALAFASGIAEHWGTTRMSVIWRAFAHRRAALIPGMLDILRTYTAAHPDDDIVKLRLADELTTIGDFAGAESIIRGRQKKEPNDHSALVGLAFLKMNAGHAPEALEAIDQALRLRPNLVGARRIRAVILSRCDRTAEAITALEQLIAEGWDEPENMANLGELLRRTGRIDDALRILERGIETVPNDIDLMSNYAAALSAKGRLDDAILWTKRVIAAGRDDADIYGDLGMYLNQTGRPAEAMEPLKRATERDPSAARSFSELGVSCLASGRPADAIAPLTRATEIDPKRFTTTYNLGAANYTLGRFADAQKAFARAVEIDPQNAMAHMYLGASTRSAGDIRGGAAAFRTLLATVGKAPAETLVNVGAFANQFGFMATAREAFARAAAADGREAAERSLLSVLGQLDEFSAMIEVGARAIAAAKLEGAAPTAAESALAGAERLLARDREIAERDARREAITNDEKACLAWRLVLDGRSFDADRLYDAIGEPKKSEGLRSENGSYFRAPRLRAAIAAMRVATDAGGSTDLLVRRERQRTARKRILAHLDVVDEAYDDDDISAENVRRVLASILDEPDFAPSFDGTDAVADDAERAAWAALRERILAMDRRIAAEKN